MTSSPITTRNTPPNQQTRLHEEHTADRSYTASIWRGLDKLNWPIETMPQPANRMITETGTTIIAQAAFPKEATAHHANEDAWVAALTALDGVSMMRLLYATVIKRTFDVVVSAVLLVVLAPFLMLTLLAVRMGSSGPAIFSQDRVGRGGTTFRLYKFRTMTFKPTEELTWMVDEDGEKRHKVRNDPRITHVGKWLRRTSVDELPQLINILKGDMSLIGPRPELVQIVREKYDGWQHERHVVRPGLTGWWQVSGRSNLPMHENSELDIYYVHHQSFRLDLLIAVKTVRVVVKGLGAF